MASQISTAAEAEVTSGELHLIVVCKRSIQKINALQAKSDSHVSKNVKVKLSKEIQVICLGAVESFMKS
jgi:hypothetical protein